MHQHPNGNVLIVDGYTETDLSGNINQYDAIYVINGGSIVVPPAVWNDDIQEWEGGYLMLEADTIYVDSTSSITANGKGFSSDPTDPDGHSGGGPGHGGQGGDVNGLESGGGGGFGGMGGSYWTTAQPGTAYGSSSQDDTNVDTLFGSAGGDYIFYCGSWPPMTICAAAYGGRGGGYLRLRGSNVTVEGTISANGGPGYPAQESIGELPDNLGSGGGSGGQIVLDSPNLTVTGQVQAKGGDGCDPSHVYSGGGGSGGRIKILQASTGICDGTFSVAGGNGAQGMARGSAGTIYMPGQPPSSPPTSLDLQSDDDTGRSNSDHLTKISTPRITGSAPANCIIRLYDGGAQVGSGDSDGGGNITANITTSLSNGLHTITATAQGVCYSESPQSTATVEVTIDTQPPAVPSTPDLDPTSDTGSSDEDNITRDWGPLLKGTSDPDSDITLYEADTALGNAYTADGNWQVSSSQLIEGTHVIAASATDAAGNESAKLSGLSMLIDTTGPVITEPSAAPLICWPAGKIFNFGMTATDALTGMAADSSQEVILRKPGAEITFHMTSASGGRYTSSWDSDGRQAGDYAVGFEAKDVAGNVTELLDTATICLLPAVAADFDSDGDVDQDDFDAFEVCASGPAIPMTVECEGKDLDHDGDGDQTDFGLFQRCLSGVDVPSDPGC